MPRLLVADDSDIMRTVLLRLLAPHCEVVAVVNGQDAIAAAASQTFDGILLDIRMPGIDGVAACRAIRSGGFEGPIIALTADESVSRDSEFASAGFTDLIEKPFAAETLLNRILACFEGDQGES
jgi:CheY-like chemotaxis protein